MKLIYVKLPFYSVLPTFINCIFGGTNILVRAIIRLMNSITNTTSMTNRGKIVFLEGAPPLCFSHQHRHIPVGTLHLWARSCLKSAILHHGINHLPPTTALTTQHQSP